MSTISSSPSPPSTGRLVPWESPKVSQLSKLRQQQKQRESMKPIISLVFYAILIFLTSFIPVEYINKLNFFENKVQFSKWINRIEYILCFILLLIALIWGYYKHLLKQKRYKFEKEQEIEYEDKKRKRKQLRKRRKSSRKKFEKEEYLSPEERRLLGIGEFGNEDELIRSIQFSGEKQKNGNESKKKQKDRLKKQQTQSKEELVESNNNETEKEKETIPDAAKYAQLTPPIQESSSQQPLISSYTSLNSSIRSQYSHPPPPSSSSTVSGSPSSFRRRRSIFAEPITDERWIDKHLEPRTSSSPSSTILESNRGNETITPEYVSQQPSFYSPPSDSILERGARTPYATAAAATTPTNVASLSDSKNERSRRKTWESSLSPLSSPSLLLSSPSTSTQQYQYQPQRTSYISPSSPSFSPQRTFTDFSSIQPYSGFNTNLSLSGTTTSPTYGVSSPLYQQSFQRLSGSDAPYRISPSPRVKSPKDKSKTTAGNNAEAMKVLDEFGISQYADKWVENIRKWLGTFVLIPLVKKIEELDGYLKDNGLEPYTCDHALDETLPASAGVPPVPIPPGRQLTLHYVLNTLANIKQPQQQAFGNAMLGVQSKLAKYRCNLEVYLNIPNCPRDYLLERLKSLSQDGYLAQFRWDNGQEYKGSAWDSKKLPTDAHIVMHLFFAYFDLLSNGSSSLDVSKGFTSRHLITSDEKEKMKSSSTYVLESQKIPPHYQVCLSGRKVEVLQGRNNIFHSMLLFIYHVIKEYDGFIDQIDMSTIFGDVIVYDF